MATVREITEYFAGLVPPEMKMNFDNVGLLAGDGRTEVTRALAALDVTGEVIDEAKSTGAQIILAHHPLFFELKEVNDGSVTGRLALELIRSGISCLCQHTNLDCVPGGVNDALAEKLGVSPMGWLEGPFYTKDGREYGMGRLGSIASPLPMPEFLSFVMKALSCAGLRYYDGGRPVSKIALCGGSGGEYVSAAMEKGCDTLVTADVKYHQFLEARAMGLNLVDAGHFPTENVVVPVLATLLKQGFPGVEVEQSKALDQTVRFF